MADNQPADNPARPDPFPGDSSPAGAPGAGTDTSSQQRPKLIELLEEVRECRRCALAETRTNVVFGAGNAGARLMFVGEAPGYHEDQQALPFVGQAGKLLEKLLARIGLTRQDVFIANVLKCRPPENRDPLTEEIAVCREFLERQIDIISPLVICTLGNFSTRLLSGKPDGITRVRGAAQPMPGHDGVSIFPVYHPAAALYTRSNLAVLEQDFDVLGGLIGAGPGTAKPGHESPDAAGDGVARPAPEAGSANPQVVVENDGLHDIKPHVTPEVFPQIPPDEAGDRSGSGQLGLF